MKYTTIFLDLDGTLIDSKPGVTKSFSRALSDFGINVPPTGLNAVIGPPLRDSFRTFGLTGERNDDAVARFRKYYTADGIFDLAVYQGVPEMVSALHAAGKKLILATSKQQDSALRILEHFGLAPFFTGVAGADLSCDRLSKAAVLRYACAQNGITAMTGCVMAGDRKHDVHGAHELGMPCVGVLYGYGDRWEMEKAGADAIVPSVDALQEWLLRG